MRLSYQIDKFVLVQDNRIDDMSKGFEDLYGIDCKCSQHKLQYEQIYKDHWNEKQTTWKI